LALQRDGRASWRSIAESIDRPVATVVRHGRSLLTQGLVRITASPALGARGRFDNYIVQIRCRPGTHLAIAETLLEWPSVRFCSLVTGDYDIVAELVVNGGVATYPALLTGLRNQPEIVRWKSMLIIHVYKSRNDWGRQLLVGEGAGNGKWDAGQTSARPAIDSGVGDAHECDASHLDATDWRIIDAFIADGRRTCQSVADEIGASETNVRRRFERLRTTGCVSILVLVPSALLGMGAETLMTVTVDPAALDRVAQALAAHPSVRYVAALLDRNALLCEVIAPNTAGLHAFATQFLAQCVGVREWTASAESLNLKRGFVETPWWRPYARGG
jgi:DNA-binding Lrp family transcriptional regulator